MKERGLRKGRFVWNKFVGEPGAMVLLGGTVCGVYALAVYEAMLNVRCGVPVGEVWKFVFR